MLRATSLFQSSKARLQQYPSLTRTSLHLSDFKINKTPEKLEEHVTSSSCCFSFLFGCPVALFAVGFTFTALKRRSAASTRQPLPRACSAIVGSEGSFANPLSKRRAVTAERREALCIGPAERRASRPLEPGKEWVRRGFSASVRVGADRAADAKPCSKLIHRGEGCIGVAHGRRVAFSPLRDPISWWA